MSPTCNLAFPVCHSLPTFLQPGKRWFLPEDNQMRKNAFESDLLPHHVRKAQRRLGYAPQFGRKGTVERVTGRKPRGPQVAGEYKLQAADFFPSLFCLRLTFLFLFFSFLKPWADNGSTNQYSCQLYGQGWHTVCHPISKMHIVGEEPAETPSALRCFFYLIRSSLADMKTSNRGTLSVPF